MITQSEYLVYNRTNEDLSAIVEGLEIKPTDRVLMCCGAGNALFASLALTSHVKGVDINKQQIEYTFERTRMLTKRDYYGFFGLDDLGDKKFDRPLNEKDICYLLGIEDEIPVEDIDFSQQFPKFELMRSRVGGLSLESGDFYDVLAREAGDYNKIFISNILALVAEEKMRHIINSLPVGAVIYFSGNHHAALLGNNCEEEFYRRFPLDPRLTSIARSKEGDFWKPEVYVKVD